MGCAYPWTIRAASCVTCSRWTRRCTGPTRLVNWLGARHYRRFDWTSAGFHAIVLRAGGTVYVDPWALGDVSHVVSYYKKDYRRATDPGFRCGVTGDTITGDEVGWSPSVDPSIGPFGGTKRTYRLALAATGEYTAFHGGTVTSAVNNGLVPVVCPEAAQAIQPGETVSVDLSANVVRCNAGIFPFQPPSESVRRIIEAGGLIEMLRQVMAGQQ